MLLFLGSCYASTFENLWTVPITFNGKMGEDFLYNHMYKMKYVKKIDSIILLTGDGLLVYSAKNGVQSGKIRKTVNFLPECINENIYIEKKCSQEVYIVQNEKKVKYEIKSVLEDSLIQMLNIEDEINAYEIVNGELFYFAHNRKKSKRYLAGMNLKTGKKIVFEGCDLTSVDGMFVDDKYLTLYGDSNDFFKIISFNKKTMKKVFEKALKNKAERSYGVKVIKNGGKYYFISNTDDVNHMLLSIDNTGKENIFYQFKGFFSSIISASEKYISVRNVTAGTTIFIYFDEMKLFKEISSDDYRFDQWLSDDGTVIIDNKKLKYFDFITDKQVLINQYKGTTIMDVNYEDNYIFVLTDGGRLSELALNRSVLYLNCIADRTRIDKK